MLQINAGENLFLHKLQEILTKSTGNKDYYTFSQEINNTNNSYHLTIESSNHYSDAIRYISSGSLEPPKRIIAVHLLRNDGYYARFLLTSPQNDGYISYLDKSLDFIISFKFSEAGIEPLIKKNTIRSITSEEIFFIAQKLDIDEIIKKFSTSEDVSFKKTKK